MRIAFVIDQLDCGGAEQQLVSLCQGLRRRNHDVHVISIHNRLELRRDLDDVQVPIDVVGKHGAYDITAIWRLRNALARIAPDIVHAFLPTASLMTPLCRWLGLRAPVLQSERGMNEWRSRTRIAIENLVRVTVDQITCNADAIKRHLEEVEGVRPECISVIYNGVRSDRRERPPDREVEEARRQIGAPANAFIVMCVANFSPIKRHDVLLEAYARARDRVHNLFLVLVGHGEKESQIREQVAALGLGSACRIITDSRNPCALLCASDVAILTSALEGCSNALLEAMAMGLPVIATEAGGNPELVVDRAGGYVRPVNDVDALADAIVGLASDREAAAAMGRFNMRRVRERFTDDAMVEASVALYESVVRRRVTRSHSVEPSLMQSHRTAGTVRQKD
jgi:glycosyltransferase involved in cell wall biosynthesis